MLEKPPTLSRKMNKFFTRNEPIQVSQKTQRRSKIKVTSSQRHSTQKEMSSVTESSTTAALTKPRSRNYKNEADILT